MNKAEIAKFERELIQSIIHKQEDIRYKNFGWSVAIISAVSIASLSDRIVVPALTYILMTGFLLILFAFFDIVHRSEFYKMIDRSEVVEAHLREGSGKYDGPLVEATLKKKSVDSRTYKDARFLIHYGLLIIVIISTFFSIAIDTDKIDSQEPVPSATTDNCQR